MSIVQDRAFLHLRVNFTVDTLENSLLFWAIFNIKAKIALSFLGCLLYNRKYSCAGNFREFPRIPEIFLSRNCLRPKVGVFSYRTCMSYTLRRIRRGCSLSPIIDVTSLIMVRSSIRSHHWKAKNLYFLKTYGRISRNFHVAKFSCYTVSYRIAPSCIWECILFPFRNCHPATLLPWFHGLGSVS